MRDQDFFWEGVKAGKLLFQKCSACGTVRQPPGPMCPACQSLSWEPHEARGRGTVAAWILSRHPSLPDENPRIVGLIELEDGIRMISNLREIELSRITLNMPVEVFFDAVGSAMLPQFRPCAGAAS